MGLRMITANRLREGDVVYLTAAGGWTTRLADGHAVEGDAAEMEWLARAEEDVARQMVVGPYAMAVDRVGDRLAPVGRREMIRAQRGPSPLSDTEHRANHGVDSHVPV